PLARRVPAWCTQHAGIAGRFAGCDCTSNRGTAAVARSTPPRSDTGDIWRSPMTRRYTARRTQSGQSLVEFCIVVPAFLFLILVTFQLVLIYRAKSTLDYAAFQAARAGAVSGVDHSKMRSALAFGLTPLLATSPDVAGVA